MENDGQQFAGDDPAQAHSTEREQVAITGSPNTVNEVAFDVRSEHLQTPLLGTLLSFETPVKTSSGQGKLLVLGQVAEIETRNRWHEDESLKNYIKLRGKLPHLTEVGDTTTGTLQIVGAYQKATAVDNAAYEKTRLPVPPGSGLGISKVDKGTIESIMAGEDGYAYLGRFYGSEDVPAPVTIRHFGDFDKGGTGEAYMGGVFGPTGSGKSVIAASLISQWASNPEMGVLILDPQSEFSENAFAKGSAFEFNFHELLQRFSGARFKPDNHVVSLDELQLEGTQLFVQILKEKQFFEMLGLSSGKASDAAESVKRFLDDLKEDNSWSPNMLWEEINNIDLAINGKDDEGGMESSFGFQFVNEAANAYASGTRKQKVQEFFEQWNEKSHRLENIWNETAALFGDTKDTGSQRHNLFKLLKDTILKGEIRIIDLNPRNIEMSEDFKFYLMDFVFRKIRQISYVYYKKDKVDSNCLIVLDEAANYIPQSPGDNDTLRQLTKNLTESVAMLRKMRCGFMFITQTVAGIQKDIYRQLHFRIYGVGLGIGADAEHMRSKEGEEAFSLYKTLPDPRLSGTFSFMIGGILLTLGSSGRPMVIEGFPSGTALLEANAHLIKKVKQPTLTGVGQAVESE